MSRWPEVRPEECLQGKDFILGEDTQNNNLGFVAGEDSLHLPADKIGAHIPKMHVKRAGLTSQKVKIGMCETQDLVSIEEWERISESPSMRLTVPEPVSCLQLRKLTLRSRHAGSVFPPTRWAIDFEGDRRAAWHKRPEAPAAFPRGPTADSFPNKVR